MKEFAEVYQQYYTRVYRFLLSLTGSPHQADEYTQEVFFRALLHIHQYQEKAGMYAWLCAIGKNLWLDNLRRCRHLADVDEDTLQSLSDPVPLREEEVSTFAEGSIAEGNCRTAGGLQRSDDSSCVRRNPVPGDCSPKGKV